MANFYAEGVDLKVAEKYRVPPRIAVDRDVLVHVGGGHYKQLTADPEAEYDFNLERNVIQKIEEWKRVHDQTEHDRQEQLRARDRERRQLIEQQQKQLLNQVSYPSTDDLSSDGEEQKARAGPEEADESSGGAPPPSAANARRSEVTATSAHRMQSDFSVILQPTVVPESKRSGPSGGGGGSGLKPSSSTATQNGGGSSSSTNVFSNSSRGHSRNHSDLNYSEWESDNYSPFDRMELKSINDLDILAQVLQTTQVNRNAALSLSSPPALDNKDATPPSPPSSPVEEQLPKAVEDEPKEKVAAEGESTAEDRACVSHSWNMASSSSSSAQVSNGSADIVTTFPNYQMLPPQQHPQDYGQPQQHLQQSQGYYNDNNNQNHHQQQQQQLQHPPPQYHSNIPTFNHINQFATMQQYSANYHQSYTSDQHHQQPHQIVSQQHAAAFNGHHQHAEREEQKSNSLLKSRSKSVPDIVNELEEEVKASEQRRRVRNHSQSCKATEEEAEDDEEEGTASPAPLQAYDRLPPDSRTLALKISKMGFPVNVVATVIEQLGNDDKKIIEHLIPLSELLDLGFGISPTSEALLKFNNNRERALDFLIS